MPATPKVSVITAVYNGELYLEQTIQSVLAQTYPNIEYIVIDGGSSDGTVAILHQYSSDLAYWVSERDQGIYDAWNKGVQAATGDWIAFLGADDLLFPDAIALYIKEIEGKDLEFVSSRVELVTNDLAHLLDYGRPWKWETHKHQMKVSHVGAFHHRSLFERFGLFDTSYKIAGDYEFLLRPGASLKTHFIPKVTAKMRATGVSSTGTKVFREAQRAKHETGKLPAWRCAVDYYYYLAKNAVVGKLRSLLRGRKEARENQ
ncbi:glycosyltransferase family 2 protein [Rufibacter sp. LB8]|uniref:glycosyltransferase family 2 protein n=1 Tax=Rufibacter sp. LB8 TaxID=2777781 RepID=UPI00178C4FA7|nr:glycosyltransferase family 2 protein [Rufibacter sp. LB8]